MNERDKALEYYRKSLSDGKIKSNDFIEMLEGDSEYIINNNVDPNDLPIITDHILFELDD
jgi:hypothetical protein